MWLKTTVAITLVVFTLAIIGFVVFSVMSR